MKRPVYTGLDKTEFGTSPFPVFFQKGIIFLQLLSEDAAFVWQWPRRYQRKEEQAM